MSRRVLVTGAAGQDGWYLSRLLRERGYEVHAHALLPGQHSDISDLTWHNGDLVDVAYVEALLRSVRPDEIYNLAAFSQPRRALDAPVESSIINAISPISIFDFARRELPDCRIFQASSSEIFGPASGSVQNEATPCAPVSPYGIAKLYAHQMAGFYRKWFNLYVCSGILFNHESPRRPLHYVSQKIAHAAAAVGLGLAETSELDERGRPIVTNGKVALGDLEVRRDFGFAGDYVEAMWRMLQQTEADDYVVGTGESHSIGEFCEVAFAHVGRDWRDHVLVDSDLLRPIDSRLTVADFSKARSKLGWEPRTSFPALVASLVDARLAALKK
jgi:GDPmannose 4,6-dehydratase